MGKLGTKIADPTQNPHHHIVHMMNLASIDFDDHCAFVLWVAMWMAFVQFDEFVHSRIQIPFRRLHFSLCCFPFLAILHSVADAAPNRGGRPIHQCHFSSFYHSICVRRTFWHGIHDVFGRQLPIENIGNSLKIFALNLFEKP